MPNPRILSLYDPTTWKPQKGCLNCKWLDRTDMATCKAFPNGIPFPILSGDRRHDTPHPEDGGIQWEAAPDAPTGLPRGVPVPS